MPVTRVDFIGNAAQLLQTYRSIGAASTVLSRQIDALNKASLNQKGLTTPQGNRFIRQELDRFVGPAAENIRTEFDAVNKVLRTTSDTFLNLGKNGKFLTGTLEEVHSNTDDITKAAERLSTVETRGAAVANRYGTAYQNLKTQLNGVIAARKASTRAAIDHIRAEEAAGIIDPSSSRYLQRRELDRYKRFLSTPAVSNIRTEKLDAYDRLLENITRTSTLAARATTQLDRVLAAPPSTKPAGFDKIPRGVLQQLERRGLGRTPVDLFGQGARVDLYEDLIHGTTRANVAFRNLHTGALVQGQVEWDKYGKAVTRFGGNLSGIQNLLNQTVRNLQKVIQWTAATTLVFGTLAFAASELGILVTLDKNLQQLSITAQATSEQTRNLFSGLADVAYETATPLADIVKAADDIALAVRSSGSSSKEYQQDILNLTQAVGIFTNLTGTDTVQATDLLTSAMKQLGIQTEDVIAVLSKVTAVAGGQSNAISDITQVLAVMSEAARQAGLTIDETIATAQVLSQVTAKSPAEIATAFKNLTGSLDSRAGAKALAEFNIDLKDSAGNVRNILDIYDEISDKIRQGIIPAGEVKALVKAIAGGPRRVPDAAALLSNIDTIQQVTERSINATNEALIANAQILDTTQAKLTQLKVIVDRFAFEKFGPALAQTIEGLLDAANKLFEILNKVDSSFISTAIQAGIFLLAMRIGITLLSRFAVGLFGVAENAILAGKALRGYTINAQGAAAAGAGAGAGATPILGGSGRRVGAQLASGALLGGAVSFASGGNAGQNIGGALQGAGLSALFLPIPIPHINAIAKIGGVALLAAGSLLQMVSANNQVAESSRDVQAEAEKAISAFAAYDEARSQLEGLGQTQKELAESISNINKSQEKSSEELAQLNDFQSQYVKNALAMADANVKLKESQDILNDVIGPEFAQAIQASRNGLLSKAQTDALLREYQLEILRKTRPDLAVPEDIDVPRPRDIPILPFSTEEFTQSDEFRQRYGEGAQRESGFLTRQLGENPAERFDIREFYLVEDGFKRVKDLFADGEWRGAVLETGENFDIVNEALRKLAESGDPAAAELQKIFDGVVRSQDAFRAADLNLAVFQARIQAMAAIGDPAAGSLQKIYDLIFKISSIAQEQGDASTLFSATTYLADLLEGKIKATRENLTPFLETYAEQVGIPLPRAPIEDREGALNGPIIAPEDTNVSIERLLALQAIVDDLGIDFDFLGEAGAAGLGLISDEAAELIEQLQEVRDDLISSYAQRSGDLRARFQGGEFGGEGEPSIADYNAEVNQLQALEEQVTKVTAAYELMVETDLEGFNASISEFAEQLSVIPGLEDAQSLSTTELVQRMFELAETYGLTGQQVDQLGGKLVSLGETLQQIDKIRAEFSISARVDNTAAIAQLKAIRNIIAVGGEGQHNESTAKYDAAIAKLEALQNEASTTLGSQIKDIYYKGGGSSGVGGKSGSGSGSGSTKAAAGPDVSTIDIPDAIATAYNRDALIKEAIRRAKALQATIPGAAKDAKNDIVELLKGTQNILEVRGVKDDLLRKALEELADIEKKRLEFETKADTIRRIRVGNGAFAAIANVPVNSRTGVSLGGAEGPINITLNLNGTVLTPAQLSQFADLVASALKRQIANG